MSFLVATFINLMDGTCSHYFCFCCSFLVLSFSDFRCTPWLPHEKFGHARDVSFQHPIKIYFGMAAYHAVFYVDMLCWWIMFSISVCFGMRNNPLCCHKGAKFGSCQELQKFRIHRNRLIWYCLPYSLKMFFQSIFVERLLLWRR